MIVIPMRIKKIINRVTRESRHYELLKDKCTDKLAVYRCLETGHIETWQKKDFIQKEKKDE